MNFYIYSKAVHITKKVITFLGLALLVISLSAMLGPKGGGPSLYEEWEVPMVGYLATIVWDVILITGLMILVFAPAGKTIITFNDHEIAIGRSVFWKGKTYTYDQIVELKRDYENWSKDVDEYLWKIKFQNGKTLRFLVYQDFTEKFEKHINSIESIDIKV